MTLILAVPRPIPAATSKASERLRCSNGENTAEEVLFMYKDSSNRNTAEVEKKNTKNTEEREKENRGQGDLTAPFRDIHVLTNAGLLTAAAIVLGFFKIPLTDIIEIRFASLPVAIAGYLFGPVIGGAVGALSDLGGYFLKPTGPFFPGFTITSMVSGIIFGLMLHGRKPTLQRILAAQIVYTVICGILLNSIWLSMLYGNGFIAVLSARLVKELVMIPVQTLMLAAIMEPIRRFRYA